MSPEDLQIAHTHLFPCVDRQKLTCNAPETSTVCSELLNNPRFDLVARSSHLPEFLERILAHLAAPDIQNAIQVSKAWSRMFCQDDLYGRVLGNSYPIDCKVTELFYPGKSYKWLFFHIQAIVRELSSSVRIIHSRVDLTFPDYLLMIESNESGRIVSLSKSASGTHLRTWQMQRDGHSDKMFSANLPISPSALSVDPQGAWVAAGTYLRQDSGPHLYSLTSGKLLFKPLNTSIPITALLAFSVLLTKTSTCLLASGASDGSICLWRIPSEDGTNPLAIATLIAPGARAPILGFSFIQPATLVVASRSGAVLSYRLHLKKPNDFDSLDVVLASELYLEAPMSEDYPFLKFSSRASNLALASSTTLHHLLVLPVPHSSVYGETRIFLLSSQHVPCFPGSIDFTYLPLASFNPRSASLIKLPLSLNQSLISVFGIWCVNPRPTPTIPIHLFSPLMASWSEAKGSHPRRQSAYTCLKTVSTDTLILGGRDSHIHMIKINSHFPSNFKPVGEALRSQMAF
ncbi:hypothetical protein DSO57_1020865 [Entomophthora muscae]|nr:hypothetical protein DSO57_1020865 [Entomophthora muscae]